MAQKKKTQNDVDDIFSRTTKYNKFYFEDLEKTKQQQFDFKKLNTNLHNEKVRKSKGNKKTHKKRSASTNRKQVKDQLLIVLVIVCTLFSILCIYALSTPKIVTKTVTKTVVDENILFLGDSITYMYNLNQYYPDINVVNSGMSANRTVDILSDMDKRVYQYNPSKVFILIGTNDIIANCTTDEIVNNIEKIIKEIKKNRPICKIYLESVYPINNTNNSKINHSVVNIRTNEKIQAINNKLNKYAKKHNVQYINMYNILADENGNLKLQYTKEGLHLVDKGYQVVTKEIKKYLNEKQNYIADNFTK